MHDSHFQLQLQPQAGHDHASSTPSANGAVIASAAPDGAHQPQPASMETAQAPGSQQPPRLLILVRHGQTTYNVENRLPGQLPGVVLTDEGRRQALRAAVALSGLPLSAVISSPLERASETAEIIARGWDLPVRTDPRLKDTDVGPFAGQPIAELKKNDPRWDQYVAHPNEPPAGVESFEQVQRRAVAALRDLLAEEGLGSAIAVVAHADVIKLILAHYSGMASESARFVSIANASISALAFGETPQPHVLAVNWTALPAWLSAPPMQPSTKQAIEQAPQAQAPAKLAEAQTPGGQHEEPVA